jgi:hypothetical protein
MRLSRRGPEPSHGKEGAESAVARNDVPLTEIGPELPKELTFMHAQGAAGKMQERPAFEAKKAHQFHYGKAASFLLIGGEPASGQTLAPGRISVSK